MDLIAVHQYRDRKVVAVRWPFFVFWFWTLLFIFGVSQQANAAELEFMDCSLASRTQANAYYQNVTATDSEGIYADSDSELRAYCISLYNNGGATCSASVGGQVYFESGTANLRTSDVSVLVQLPPAQFTDVCFPWSWSDDSNRIGDVERWLLPLGGAVENQAPSSCWNDVRIGYYSTSMYGTETNTALMGATYAPNDACLLVNPDIGFPEVIQPVGEVVVDSVNSDSYYFTAVVPYNADIDWWESVTFSIYDSLSNEVCRLDTTANFKGGVAGYGGDRQVFQARLLADFADGFVCEPLDIGSYTVVATAYDGDMIPSEPSPPVSFEVVSTFDADAIIAEWCDDLVSWKGNLVCGVATLFWFALVPSTDSFNYMVSAAGNDDNSPSNKILAKVMPSDFSPHEPSTVRNQVGGIEMPSEEDLFGGISAWFEADPFVESALIAIVWLSTYGMLFFLMLIFL